MGEPIIPEILTITEEEIGKEAFSTHSRHQHVSWNKYASNQSHWQLCRKQNQSVNLPASQPASLSVFQSIDLHYQCNRNQAILFGINYTNILKIRCNEIPLWNLVQPINQSIDRSTSQSIKFHQHQNRHFRTKIADIRRYIRKPTLNKLHGNLELSISKLSNQSLNQSINSSVSKA